MYCKFRIFLCSETAHQSNSNQIQISLLENQETEALFHRYSCFKFDDFDDFMISPHILIFQDMASYLCRQRRKIVHVLISWIIEFMSSVYSLSIKKGCHIFVGKKENLKEANKEKSSSQKWPIGWHQGIHQVGHHTKWRWTGWWTRASKF